MLCIETNLLVHVPLNTFPFYLLIFLCPCVYYTMIYVRSVGARYYDERTLWFRKNLSAIRVSLWLTMLCVIGLVIFLFCRNFQKLILLSPIQCLLLFLFPLIAAWYTFSPSIFNAKKIRQTGWIKPFIVGLIWAAWVIIYPLMLVQIRTGKEAKLVLIVLLLLQNFIFFSINAIIFDIKDCQPDRQHHLNTLPVIFGVRDTFRFIVAPLIVLDLTVFFIFHSIQHFSVWQTFVQTIPYLLMIAIVLNYRSQRSVLYYLVAVDGLVFVKAVCGISSVVFL